MKSMLSFVLVSLFVPRPIRATSISPSLTGRSITNPSTRVRALKLRNSARFDQIEPLNSEIPHVLIEPCAISAIFEAQASSEVLPGGIEAQVTCVRHRPDCRRGLSPIRGAL